MTRHNGNSGGDAGGGLNKGQSLVAAFRAARISQRPALRSELRSNRAALRQERIARLARQDEVSAVVLPDASEPSAEPHVERLDESSSETSSSTSSIFAGFIDRAEQGEGTQPASAPDMQPPVSVAPVAQQMDEAARAPLSSIGFGPGMMIRLSHLGIETVSDLARADPAWLTTSLGDISRLINVDAWIESARSACAAAA